MRLPAGRLPWWDHLLVDEDDPEEHITDLERQLADTSGVAPLPAVPDRRFVARIIPDAKRQLITLGLLSAGAVVLLAGGAALTLAAPTNPALIPIAMLVGLVVLVALALLALRRLNAKKVVMCVTTDGLTIDQRPGDAFSFRDAELGQWRTRGASAGRALYLTSGPHRFVLGERGSRFGSELPIQGPQVNFRQLDAWTETSAFDELLAIVGSSRGGTGPR